MNYIILGILSITFLYFNFKIIQKDIKEKIIPNKYLLYLLYLLPLLLIYGLFYYNIEVNYLILFFQIIFSIFVSFLLYYFGIWGAGDAKYLLVLSLFISHIGIMKFVGNIAIILLLYILGYFIYFYFGKCLFNLTYSKSLYKNIYIDLKDKFFIFLDYNNGVKNNKTSIKILLNWIILFLFVFISFRLVRLYLVSDYTLKNNIEFFGNTIKNYQLYLMILVFTFFFIVRYIIKYLFIKLKSFFEKKYSLKYDKTKLFLPLSLISILIGFIIYEYIINPYEIGKYLYKIFTFYILLYIFLKIIFYLYKIAFHISETYYIDINKLYEGDIIDKQYLINMFGKQKCLGYKNDLGILSPNPGNYFLKISNRIDSDTVEKIKKIYSIVNNFHLENNTINYSPINSIKILINFSFAPYIFIAFLTTLFFHDTLYIFFTDLFIKLIKMIFN